jgi:NAD+ kinase
VSERRVGIILKRGQPQAAEIARALVPILDKRGARIFTVDVQADLVPGSSPIPESELGGAIDLCVVLGGDGTLLYAASTVADRGVPVLGLNLGHLGFLTSFDPKDAELSLVQALDGELEIEERMMLRATLHPADDSPGESRLALNDVVLGHVGMARLIRVEAYLDGAHVTTYIADGILVSTPTGSTAYNLAAGGPIVTPDTPCMIVSPICAHTLTNRPLVVPPSARLTARLLSDEGALLTMDGRWSRRIDLRDRVEVKRAEVNLRLYRSPARGFFRILRDKLRWGEREPEPRR